MATRVTLLLLILMRASGLLTAKRAVRFAFLQPSPTLGRTRSLSVSSAGNGGADGVTSSRTVRVSSYNVLSSSLSTPSNMPFNDPSDLDPENRYRLILQRLEGEVEKQGIICLQEVSRLWAGQLHVYFAKRGYHFVTALYGYAKNGYMGVGMAWPTSLYEVEAMDLHRLSDDMAQLARKPRGGILSRVFGLGSKLLSALGIGKKEGRDSTTGAWLAAKDRKNVMIFAKFRQLTSNARFAVSTYHMPCMFYMPQAMVIHSALAVQRTQMLAEDMPHIICGDFNFRPDSSMYQLVTTGSLQIGHPEYPTLADESIDWRPDTRIPLQSAYMEHQGIEPEFTNFAQMRDEPFMGTLDYIFLSPGWQVVDTHKTPSKPEEVGGRPLPSGGEPSDHLFIAASAIIPSQGEIERPPTP